MIECILCALVGVVILAVPAAGFAVLRLIGQLVGIWISGLFILPFYSFYVFYGGYPNIMDCLDAFSSVEEADDMLADDVVLVNAEPRRYDMAEVEAEIAMLERWEATRDTCTDAAASLPSPERPSTDALDLEGTIVYTPDDEAIAIAGSDGDNDWEHIPHDMQTSFVAQDELNPDQSQMDDLCRPQPHPDEDYVPLHSDIVAAALGCAPVTWEDDEAAPSASGAFLKGERAADEAMKKSSWPEGNYKTDDERDEEKDNNEEDEEIGDNSFDWSEQEAWSCSGVDEEVWNMGWELPTIHPVKEFPFDWPEEVSLSTWLKEGLSSCPPEYSNPTSQEGVFVQQEEVEEETKEKAETENVDEMEENRQQEDKEEDEEDEEQEKEVEAKEEGTEETGEKGENEQKKDNEEDDSDLEGDQDKDREDMNQKQREIEHLRIISDLINQKGHLRTNLHLTGLDLADVTHRMRMAQFETQGAQTELAVQRNICIFLEGELAELERKAVAYRDRARIAEHNLSQLEAEHEKLLATNYLLDQQQQKKGKKEEEEEEDEDEEEMKEEQRHQEITRPGLSEGHCWCGCLCRCSDCCICRGGKSSAIVAASSPSSAPSPSAPSPSPSAPFPSAPSSSAPSPSAPSPSAPSPSAPSPPPSSSRPTTTTTTRTTTTESECRCKECLRVEPAVAAQRQIEMLQGRLHETKLELQQHMSRSRFVQDTPIRGWRAPQVREEMS